MLVFDIERYESGSDSRLVQIVLFNGDRLTVECLEGFDLAKFKIEKFSKVNMAYGNPNLVGSLRIDQSYGVKPSAKDHAKFSVLLRSVSIVSEFSNIPVVFRFLTEYFLGYCAISDNANHLGIKPLDPDKIEFTLNEFTRLVLTRTDNRYTKDDINNVILSLRMIDTQDSVKLASMIDRALSAFNPNAIPNPIVSVNNGSVTKASVKAELDDLGITYRKKASLNELVSLRDQALEKLTDPDQNTNDQIDTGLNDPIDPTV